MHDWLQLHIAEVQTLCLTTKSEVRPRKKVEYDVFISYSHSNANAANSVYKHLSIAHPDWNIFIDISELKTGVAWQIKLYESIGNMLHYFHIIIGYTFNPSYLIDECIDLVS